MWDELLSGLIVVFVSAFRHTFGGIPIASGYGFSYIEVALLSAIGGTIGLILFIYVGQFIRYLFLNYFNFRKKEKKKKVFNFRTRLIIKIKQRWGLFGIAFLTPPLLSIPFGTMIASALYKNKRKVFVTLFVSVLFWSFVGAFMSFLPFENLFAFLRP